MQTMNFNNASSIYSNYPNFLDRMDTVITQNIDNENFCVADLRHHLLMSDSQIYRKVKKQAGCSPSVYIRRKRLGCAYDLILQSDLSLSEISYQVGFNGLSYFSRCFSKFYGVTPSSLRYARA